MEMLIMIIILILVVYQSQLDLAVQLDNIVADEKYVAQVHGSILSIGCNNEGDLWCTTTGTANNLDPVNTTITFKTKTQEETLNYNFTSDYNDGTITSTFTINLNNDFHINETIIDVNVFGADTGDKTGQFGTIIDDLTLTLTLADLVVAQTTEISEITQITAPESIIGGLDSVSIVDTLSSGIIDINPPEDIQVANLSPQISVISDIRTEQMNMEIADVGINNDMPTSIDVGADVPVDDNMLDMDMTDIEMPDIQMPDNLPEINDIQIESVNEIQNEPETLQEIREEIPENNIEELPTELEETNMEEDLKENQNEQQEETATENEEVDGANEESELSDDSSTEEKEPEPKEEISENEEKESEEKEETAEEEVKEEPSANDEKVVKTAKSSKSEKKQGSNSPKSSDKKTSVASTTLKIKSNIVIQDIDIKTIVSFNKEYFEVKITDTLDLTTTEIDFYDGQGFNNTAYAQNNIDFFALDCKSDCWGNIYLRTNAIQIDSFRR
jgi:hypothetical protein